jgi:hypothetical protein
VDEAVVAMSVGGITVGDAVGVKVTGVGVGAIAVVPDSVVQAAIKIVARISTIIRLNMLLNLPLTGAAAL